MHGKKVQRRLAAILAADVVGYSRLMRANEVGTLATLNAHRRDLIDPAIAEHHGRIVKLTGDGLLAEFASVVNAVECATRIQQGMQGRNADTPDDRRVDFRIGIHLGDIISEGGDIFGDGVNIAARLESVAKPGGVAISAVVRENVENRLDLSFEDIGEQALKNIDRPVLVFNVYVGAPPQQQASVPARSISESAPAGKPSIAVLPFVNMSGDPEQEFFSDGITEDIITDLSKISALFVVGRHSAFAYKGQGVDLRQVARELGVGFLLEGSVRKAGQRVRITGQLIDGSNGGHLWAERYDRDLTDVFAVQDEITRMIVDQLRVRLLPQERAAIERSPTSDVEAYSQYLRARQIFHSGTKASLLLARRMFARAVEIDPAYARAFAGIADCDSRLRSKHGVTIPSDEILAIVGQALAIDPDLAEAHAARGYALMVADRRDEAAVALQRALSLDPNCHEAHYHFADYSVTAGDFEKAAEHYVRALEIRPDDYLSPILLLGILRSLGRSHEAEGYARIGLMRAEEALKLHPEDSKPAQLGATALATLGERDRAKEWLGRALAIDPDDNSTRYNAACVYALLGDTERAIDLLEVYLRQVGPDLKRWFKNDSDLDSIRSHPRYANLLQLAGSGEH
jgi:adenylate cyclase